MEERGSQSATQRLALQLPPRRAAPDHFKKGTISRAEGGQLQAPVGRRWGLYFVLVSYAPVESVENLGYRVVDAVRISLEQAPTCEDRYVAQGEHVCSCQIVAEISILL